MNKEDIKQKVIHTIANAIEKKNIAITENSKLVEDLGLDSFAAIMILNDLETDFNVNIADDLIAVHQEHARLVERIRRFPQAEQLILMRHDCRRRGMRLRSLSLPDRLFDLPPFGIAGRCVLRVDVCGAHERHEYDEGELFHRYRLFEL